MSEFLGLIIEGASTNYIRNNTMVGNVAGTPGTPPTNWAVADLGNGLTIENLGTQVINGINCVKYRVHGVTTGTAATIFLNETTTSTPASPGQVWSGSMYLALLAGSTANITSINTSIIERGAAGVYLNQIDDSGVTGLTSTPQRYIKTATLTNPLTEYRCIDAGNICGASC